MSRPIPFLVWRDNRENKLLGELLNNSKKIYERIFEKDHYHGARSGILVGPQGTGKTTALIRLAQEFSKRGYITIWREIELAQFNRIEATGTKINVYAHRDDDIVIYAMEKGGDSAEEYPVKLHRYEDAYDLYRKVREEGRGRVNVVIEPSYYIPGEDFLVELFMTRNINKTVVKITKSIPSSRFWVELLFVATHRKNQRWMALLMDEFDDVAPGIPRAMDWVIMEWMKDNVKHVRKRLVATYVATQSYSNVFWEVAEKFQDIMLKIGARKPKRCHIPERFLRDARWLMKVFNLTDENDVKQFAFVEQEGLIGLLRFPKLPDVEYDLRIEREWTGPMPTFNDLVEEYGLLGKG